MEISFKITACWITAYYGLFTAAQLIGVFTPWDQWSPCDATCGQGQRQRYRACYPLHAYCNGTTIQTEKCQLKPCPDVGIWSVWSGWGPCSRPCGIGTTDRTRACLSNRGICTGGNKEVKLCNPQACKATGGWSAWGEWSSCSANCGPGVRYQDRTCEDPPPSNGGPACRGAGTRVAHCFEKPCIDETTAVGVFNGNSFLLYPKTLVVKRMLAIYVKFRPDQQDGVILYRHHGNDTTNNRNDTIILRLEGGLVDLFLQFGGTSEWMTAPKPVTLRKWYDVFITIAGTRVSLRLDNGHPIEKSFPNLEVENVDLDQHMFVGGLSPPFILKTKISYPGFIGHLAVLRINYEDYFIETHTGFTVNEESNHPNFSHDVQLTEMDSDQLFPTFHGDDYITFVCKDCHGKPDLQVDIVIKPFQTDMGLIWISNGEEPGSFVALYFKKGSLYLCVNTGRGKRCTSTEVVPKNEWLAVNLALSGTQIKLRLNHERAQILVSDDHPYVALPFLYFAGGEQELWATIYMMTRQTRGFEGILFSLKINKKAYDVRKDIAMRETGRLVSSDTTSVAAKYEEYHEPPVSDLDFICDLSEYVTLLHGQRAYLFWIKESEIIQNFTGIEILKVPGMKHATKMSIRSTEPNIKDGFYGCLLRTDHHEILTHVFGVSFDDANEVDILEVAETAILAIVLGVCLFVLIALLVLLKLGCLKRFPSYNTIIRHLPSWFTEGHRKDFFRRHTASIKKSGLYSPDEIHRILTMQQKSIQTPSDVPLSAAYGADAPLQEDVPRGSRPSMRKSIRPSLKHSVNEFIPPPESEEPVETTPMREDEPSLLAYDPESDYDAPIARRQSEGTFFPPSVTEPYRRSTRMSMRVPEHVRSNPDAYLPGDKQNSTSRNIEENRTSWQRSSKRLSSIPDNGESERTKSTEPTSGTQSFTASETAGSQPESETGTPPPKNESSAMKSIAKEASRSSRNTGDNNPQAPTELPPTNQNNLSGSQNVLVRPLEDFYAPPPVTTNQPQGYPNMGTPWPYGGPNSNMNVPQIPQAQPAYGAAPGGPYPTNQGQAPFAQMPGNYPQNPITAPYVPQWRAPDPAFQGYPQAQPGGFAQNAGFVNQQPMRPFY